jgi:hypothetical protein
MRAGGMAQTRRMLLLAVAAALLVAGSAGSAAAAQDKPREPRLIVREGCQYLFDGLYGGQFDVVGLEPNTEYLFEYVGGPREARLRDCDPPPAARYCAGDVAGERGDRESGCAALGN